MKLLGHTKIETTMKYAAVTNQKRQSAVDNLPDYGFDKGNRGIIPPMKKEEV